MRIGLKMLAAPALSLALAAAGPCAGAWAHSLPDSCFTNVFDVLYASPSMGEDFINYEVGEWLKIPSCVREVLKARGYRIYMFYYSEDSMEERHFVGQTYLCDPMLSDVYADLDRAGGYNSLIHEAGHAVDMMYNGGQSATGKVFNASSTGEWQKLWAAGRGKLAGMSPISAYNLYDAREAFAEAFALSVARPADVYAQCPDIYMYMDRIVRYYKKVQGAYSQ